MYCRHCGKSRYQSAAASCECPQYGIVGAASGVPSQSTGNRPIWIDEILQALYRIEVALNKQPPLTSSDDEGK